jgi:hypothetical protein
MNQVFREHRNLETDCRNRCAGAKEPEVERTCRIFGIVWIRTLSHLPNTGLRRWRRRAAPRLQPS